MKTTFPTADGLARDWLHIDASGHSLGRLASQIAKLLRGKHKAIYSPHTDMGDFVVVTNAEKVVLTGSKERNKTYWRHSGYPGGIKSTKAHEVRAKHPERLIEHAVKGMLPKGPLGRRMYTKLKIYAGPHHQHEAQQPRAYDVTAKAS